MQNFIQKMNGMNWKTQTLNKMTMRHLILLIGLLWATTSSAQFEAQIGGFATNYKYGEIAEGNLTDTEVAIHGGVKGMTSLIKLFTVQEDDATLKAVASLDAFVGTKSSEFVVMPSVGLRFDFPVYIEYGVAFFKGQADSYFEAGAYIGEKIGIYTKLTNFNPYYGETLTRWSIYHERTQVVKRSIAMGVRIKL